VRTRLIALAGILAVRALAHDSITHLTWSQEISRIIYKHCVSCHREDGTAMSLATYEKARPWAKVIRDEILNRRMPPWDAVKGIGDFRNDPSLSQPEIDMLLGWTEGGAPKGSPIYLPALPHFGMPAVHTPEKEIELAGSLTLSKPMTLTGIHPHGALEVIASLADGSIQHLIWIRAYHPQWQLTYYFRVPLKLPKGTKLVLYSPTQSTATLIAATSDAVPAR
jgi:hypothetical protein